MIATYLLTYAFSNQYSSTVLTSQNSMVSNESVPNIGSLASLGGLDIGIGSTDGKISRFEIIETINSRDFFYELLTEFDEILDFFVREYKDKDLILKKYPELIVSIKNRENSDKDLQTFLRISHELYKSKFISINTDKESGFISISVESDSAVFSKSSLEKILNAINLKIKSKTIDLSDKIIFYLEDLLDKNTTIDVRSSISSMLSKELETNMLAKVQEDFALTIIDSPSISYKPVKPRRVFLSFVSFFITILLLITFYCAKYLVAVKNENI